MLSGITDVVKQDRRNIRRIKIMPNDINANYEGLLTEKCNKRLF